MNRPSFFVRLALALCLLPALAACSSREDSLKIREHQDKAGQLKLESDQLAAEAAAIQQKIRDAGTAEATGEAVVTQLAVSEKQTAAEGERLEKLAAGLKQANENLTNERAAFTQKYLKP